jgi:hypothetical protein
MAATQTARVSGFAQLVESLVEPDLVGPLNDLSEALVVVSGVVSKLRRDGAVPADHDLVVLDAAAARSITLTRTVLERLQARRLRGEYTSLSHAVLEVAASLQPAMPDALRIDVHCPLGPAIVAAERADLRRLVVALIEVAVEVAPRPGTIRLEVAESRTQQEVVLQVRCGGTVPQGHTRIETQVKPVVFALGGTFQARTHKDGAALVVRLRSEC